MGAVRLCRTRSRTGTKFGRRKVESVPYDMAQIGSLYLTCAWFGSGTWQTPRRTHGRTGAGHSPRACAPQIFPCCGFVKPGRPYLHVTCALSVSYCYVFQCHDTQCINDSTKRRIFLIENLLLTLNCCGVPRYYGQCNNSARYSTEMVNSRRKEGHE